MSEYTLADLVVKDAQLIKDIDAGKKEVSAGYDCDYVQLAPGRGRQKDIIGNHVAFVDAGRCGPRCAVRDHAIKPRSRRMTTTLDRSRAQRFMDRFRKAVATGDEEELGRLAEESPSVEEAFSEGVKPATGGDGGELHVHVHTGDAEPDEPAVTAGGEGSGTPPGEPNGDEPATRGDIIQLAMMIRQLIDMDDEEDGLASEEAEGGEVADRRMDLRDRKRGARDAFRKWADEVGEIVETEHDPDSSGRNDAPGTAGSGPKGIKSEPVHSGNAPGYSGSGDRARFRGRRPTGDGARRLATADSAGLKDPWDTLVSRAEILHPGIELYESGRRVAFDAAVSAEITERRMCALRRRTLDAAYGTSEGRAVIDEVTDGQRFNLRDAPCNAVTPVFNAASAMMADRNRAHTKMVTVDARGEHVKANPLSAAASLAELNAAFRERFKRPAAR